MEDRREKLNVQGAGCLSRCINFVLSKRLSLPGIKPMSSASHCHHFHQIATKTLTNCNDVATNKTLLRPKPIHRTLVNL